MHDGKVNTGTIQKKTGMGALSKAYLVLYNSVQSVGWSYVLVKILSFLATKQTVTGLWAACNPSVTIFQSLAVLEVLHCLIGLVPSSALITFLQIASRVFMVWGILIPIEKAQSSPTLPLMLLAWGITEVVRYSYYIFNLLGSPPRALTWCRYTFFMGLYPAGVSGEVGNIWNALDTIKETQLFSLTLPNKANISFSFYYLCIFLVISYIPTFPQLFGHMLRQRKKVLGGQIGKKVK